LAGGSNIWEFVQVRRVGARLAASAVLITHIFATGPTQAQDSWNLFTPEDDVQLGQQLSTWLAPRVNVLNDRKLEQYVQKIATRLDKAGQPRLFPVEFVLIEASEPYAVALPGGKVVLTSALLVQMENEAQLAGVLAHVLAHTQLRHPTRAASKAERFRAQAAIVVSQESDKSLLQSMDDFGLALFPGAPLMRHDAEQEAEADTEAKKWLNQAGYDDQAMDAGFTQLYKSSPKLARQFLDRHPGLKAEPRSPPGDLKSRNPIASERHYGKLRKRAAQYDTSSPGIELALEWSPPPQPEQVVKRNERFITRNYQFDYPQSWRPGKPGHDQTIQVSPKGGMDDDAGTKPEIIIGLMAGAPPMEATTVTATQTLLSRIDELRPGLKPASDQQGIEPRGPQSESILLEGTSPLDGQRELVWAVSRKLQGHFFYLLMIAPASQFSEYRAQFEAIYSSIAFEGHPTLVGEVPGKTSQQPTRPPPNEYRGTK
jgi:hypothetical protein